MHFLNDFYNFFFTSFSIIKESETDKYYEIEIEATEYLKPNSINGNIFIFLALNDICSFTLTFGDAESITLSSKKYNITNFIDKINTEYEFQSEESIFSKLIIEKTKNGLDTNIYNLKVFLAFLKSLNTKQFLTVFTDAFGANDLIIFKVNELNKAFYTSNIYFIPAEDTTLTYIPDERERIIENQRLLGHFGNFENIKLSPRDFKLIVKNEELPAFNTLFERFSTLLSIIFLFDITSLEDDELKYKINGFKTIKGSIDSKALIPAHTEEYYSIFNWVYKGGNLNDKIGLARNIITLHFKKPIILELEDETFQSIQSGYRIYEKQNIKQYIEIRNKISDQLLDFNNRANKIVETFASGFQRSSLALLSFYISAIVIRVLSKGDFIGVFSLDATILSIAFILGSFIYSKVAKWEINEQRKRFISSYSNLKERYTDLLEKGDIYKILNSDKEYKEDLDFIDDKSKKYSQLWNSVLLILLITTLILYFVYNLGIIVNSSSIRLLFQLLK